MELNRMEFIYERAAAVRRGMEWKDIRQKIILTKL